MNPGTPILDVSILNAKPNPHPSGSTFNVLANPITVFYNGYTKLQFHKPCILNRTPGMRTCRGVSGSARPVVHHFMLMLACYGLTQLAFITS